MFVDVKSFSEAGHVHNEDAFVVGENYLAVIDGASGLDGIHLTDEPSDARWFSKRVAALLCEALTEKESIVCILQRICAQIQGELEAMGYRDKAESYPSASLSIVRQCGDLLECYILGDCPILLDLDGAVTLLYDESVPKRDNAVVEQMVKIRQEQGVTTARAMELVRPLLLQNRRERNQAGSYWIFEPTGAGIRHGRFFSYDAKNVGRVAIMSDGFWEYYDELRLTTDPEAFLKKVEQQPLLDIWREMRAVQQRDAQLVQYPRLKVADDATVVFGRVTK